MLLWLEIRYLFLTALASGVVLYFDGWRAAIHAMVITFFIIQIAVIEELRTY